MAASIPERPIVEDTQIADIDALQGDELRLCAFVEYLRIAVNYDECNKRRASAWARMGRIADFEPDLCGRDADNGLYYYRQAIAFDPLCPLAWYGIVAGYGDSGPAHRDRDLFDRGMEFFTMYDIRMSTAVAYKWEAAVAAKRTIFLSGL